MRYSQVGLSPHGYHDGVIGVVCFEKYDGDVAAGDHFGYGDTSVYGDVLQPHGQAALDLHGCGVGVLLKAFRIPFTIMGCYSLGLRDCRAAPELNSGLRLTAMTIGYLLDSRLRGNDRRRAQGEGGES